MMNKSTILRDVSFGGRVAEEESANLKKYFVETNEWKRVFGAEVDVVYGPKGSGKSAIYSLLADNTAQLFDRSIFYIAAENPRGATAFKELVTDPPTSEREFEQLWKIYFSCLIAGVIGEYDLKNHPAEELARELRSRGLPIGKESLSEKFNRVFEYVKVHIRATSLEAGVKFDPQSGLPSGLTAKVEVKPNSDTRENLSDGSDLLLDLANNALVESNFVAWLAIDRLDVAFQESDVLEANALRALFKVYLDLLQYRNLRLMIFLRTDIWKRITESGFREASHITKTLTINWTRDSLLNLILKRLLQSKEVVDAFAIDIARVLSDIVEQQTLFYRIFPNQVDVGEKKPNTLDWLLSRTRDGTGHTAPRELIHLLNESREIQLQKLNIGTEMPEAETLFTRAVIKEALKPVSKVRLEQTLYAEYPRMKNKIQRLEKEKATQRLESLLQVWGTSLEDVQTSADKLAEIGFFEKRGSKQSPLYWVPFLYRDALGLIQGEAD